MHVEYMCITYVESLLYCTGCVIIGSTKLHVIGEISNVYHCLLSAPQGRIQLHLLMIRKWLLLTNISSVCNHLVRDV